MLNFLQSRQQKWKRLEDLTLKASQVRLRRLTGEEVREFGRLYRRTAADLAIAREEVKDKRLINYLNHLVGRAHGAIYRSESSGFAGILTFFRYDFPAAFRATFKYTLASFLIFLAGGVFAFVASTADENFADRVMPGVRQQIAGHQNWTERVNDANPLMSTSIQTNNITVTFFAFAGGVTAGLATFYVLLENGLMVGLIIALCIKYRFWEIPLFMAGHGVIELTAIFIAGGAGLMIGKALLIPGDLKRVDALVKNGLTAVKLVLGCVPMLLIAGFIEGFISPAHVPAYFKIAVSAASAIALTAYFLKPDHRQQPLGQ
ncbi:MAG TPA: stage II sporulation protein M [Blastocatellia bacterium]|nr:stage II sporulation protein M [Blastocatellia bacterium]